ncbi:uncharacterized protein LOC141727048 isoform X1 [Zonotrichia albicollis]|uniref:uncharacterized protein LOC141727048 isoform X1 n=1 Tax=Zonotrichia albicollis TaxID=44394 RepID=UPI003D80BFB6
MAPLGPLRALNSPRPRPAQPHWDRSHLCTPRPSHLCRPRPRGPASPPRPSPAPLPPIKAGQSAPVPFSSGDALLRMLRERRSERCEEIRIGGWCCMEPEVLRWKEPLRHGCSDRAWYCSSGCGQCGTGVLPGPDDRGLGSRRGSGPWGAGAMVVPGRQEDGASLEQQLDHGWKRVGQGNRLWQPRDPIGITAPSAPPPVPRGAPWRTRRRPSALRGHRARPGSTAATALPCTGTPRSPVRATAPASPCSVSASPGDPRRTTRTGAAAPAAAVPGVGLEEARSPRRAGSPRVLGICRRSCACSVPNTHLGVGTGTALAQAWLKRCLRPLSQGLL